MTRAKLTLSVDISVVRKAKRMAKRMNTSVSAMFARYIEIMTREFGDEIELLGPITRGATGMIQLPGGVSYKSLVEEAILAKHGQRK